MGEIFTWAKLVLNIQDISSGALPVVSHSWFLSGFPEAGTLTYRQKFLHLTAEIPFCCPVSNGKT